MAGDPIGKPAANITHLAVVDRMLCLLTRKACDLADPKATGGIIF